MLFRVNNHSCPTHVITELPVKMFIKRVCFVSSGFPLACVLRDPSVHWNNKPLADCSDSGLCGLIEWGSSDRFLHLVHWPGSFPPQDPDAVYWRFAPAR